MKYLYTYPEKCSGCKMCAIVCALKHNNECNPKMGAINIVRDEFERYEIQFVCLQCDDAECVKVCTKKALKKEGKSSNATRKDASAAACASSPARMPGSTRSKER
jgi:Fe-S-cluster-containing hydrogenase component 2